MSLQTEREVRDMCGHTLSRGEGIFRSIDRLPQSSSGLPGSWIALGDKCGLRNRQALLLQIHARKGKRTMRRMLLQCLAALTLTSGLLLTAPAGVAAQVDTVTQERPVIRRALPRELRGRPLQFVRTELFFGTAKPDGTVTEQEFFTFLDAEVTPRFPEGLTVVKAHGQFTGADGVLIKEDSFVLVLLYPLEGADDRHKRIETIRRRYMKQFQQQSVLRVDDAFTVRVSF
jgi:Protein of unknown function (DUF3574)